MTDISELRDEIRLMRQDVFAELKMTRDELAETINVTNRHTKNNSAVARQVLIDDIKAINFLIQGDGGNVNRGLIRRLDMHEQEILNRLDTLRASSPNSARPTLSRRGGATGFNAENLRYIVFGVLAILGAAGGAGGAQTLMAPSVDDQLTQAKKARAEAEAMRSAARESMEIARALSRKNNTPASSVPPRVTSE